MHLVLLTQLVATVEGQLVALLTRWTHRELLTLATPISTETSRIWTRLVIRGGGSPNYNVIVIIVIDRQLSTTAVPRVRTHHHQIAGVHSWLRGKLTRRLHCRTKIGRWILKSWSWSWSLTWSWIRRTHLGRQRLSIWPHLWAHHHHLWWWSLSRLLS